MKQFEANFDGLVGPTHNYAGLSYGNVASLNNASASSNPKQAAKQGLTKMKALADLGMVQGVLAPQERPDIASLRRLGFGGTDANVLAMAAKQAPAIFNACCSASWGSEGPWEAEPVLLALPWGLRNSVPSPNLSRFLVICSRSSANFLLIATSKSFEAILDC